MTNNDFQIALQLGKSRSDCAPQCVDDLVSIIQKDPSIPGCIVECGSWRCGASIAMAAAAEYSGSRKQVYACDTFGGLPYGEAQDGFQNFANTGFEEISEATAPFNITLIRGRHEDTMPKFPRQPVSLIFLDSDFYSSHKVVLETLWPMLSPGGSIVFHDWIFGGVQQAVNEYFSGREKEYDRCEPTPLPFFHMGRIRKRITSL